MSATVYILLFRGVGGATQLPTKPLREVLEAAGYEHPRTYINSGNALVRTSESREKVIETVAKLCKTHFGFDKDIHAPTRAEWQKVIDRNPFAKVMKEGKFLHATMLGETPKQENIDKLKALAESGEGIEIVGDVGYLLTPGGVSSSKLGMKFDKGLGVPNTARNWNTVLKLKALADEIASL